MSTPERNGRVAPDEPKNTAQVLKIEWSEIRRRRRFVGLREWRRDDDEEGVDAPLHHDLQADDRNHQAENGAPPENLAGLGLSGGGIRSATFNLGLLQGLRRYGILPSFDYLSTVSGGGYVGGWWSAWLARDPLFDGVDIIDKTRFAGELRNIATRFSGYLHERFTSEGLEAVRELSEGREREETVQRVVDELNRVVRGVPIYGDAFRLGVTMRPETAALAAEEDVDASQVNRMVLEDAYPGLIKRKSFIERGSFPPVEKIEPERSSSYIYEPNRMGLEPKELRTKISDGAMSAGHDPVHHLRLFANYLTPRKGALSGDTWRATSVVSRNLTLTWLILLPIFLAIMLVGQLYYLVNPSTTDNFLHPQAGAIVPCDSVSAQRYYLDDGSLAEEEALRQEEAHPHAVSPTNVLLIRTAALLWPIIPIAGWIVVIVIAWMICGQDGTSRRQQFIPLIEVFAMITLIACLLWIFKGEAEPGLEGVAANGFSLKEMLSWWSNWYAIIPWSLVAIGLLVVGLRTGIVEHDPPERRGEADEIYEAKQRAWRQREEARRQWRKEVRRNRLVRLHSKLLISGVLIALVLLIAGFSHEIINYIFYQELGGYVKKIGGWGALLATIAGGIFTAIKASPSGGGDKKADGTPSRFTRIVILVTPTLMVLLIALLAAWWSHGLLGHLVIGGTDMCAIRRHFLDRSEPMHYATFLGIVLAFVFSWYEMKFRSNMRLASRSLIVICLLFAVPLLTMAGLSIYARHLATPGAIPDALATRFVGGILGPMHPSAHYVSLVTAMLVGTFLAVRIVCRRPRYVDSEAAAGFVFRKVRDGSRDPVSPLYLLLIIGLIFSIVALAVFGIIPLLLDQRPAEAMHGWFVAKADKNLTGYTVMGFVLLLIYLVFELFTGRGSNNRSLGLLGTTYLALLILLVMSYLPGQTFDSLLWAHPTATSMMVMRIHGAFGLVATFLAWAIALGWTVDPNMLSIHAFYKARLTRAYMGASNYKRHQKRSEITEAVEGDDVQLWGLRNCHRGGPYHIVNTTLNLVGGSDLVTAQRSAANFIMTQHHCGSVRTGYRPTDRYMNGRVTLGTAVSISGAAASPNMGSKTPTAALAMLMTMFNVKLGYWAPTPNRDSWAEPQARLWPFYTLRELTSQTNDLSSYCYLTDGGHFENTALYALVERGCRYILISDCGADPQPNFADLGDAIRRCRIDFGIECELDILPVKVKIGEGGNERYGTAHFVVGKLTYAEAHLQRLRGHSRHIAEEERTGYILVVKPTLVGSESVDVRQYGFENNAFPQQSTGDQWYDEAQFESYRKLGELSIDSVIDLASDLASEVLGPTPAVPYSAHIHTTAQILTDILDELKKGKEARQEQEKKGAEESEEDQHIDSVLRPEQIPLFFEGIHTLIEERKRREERA